MPPRILPPSAARCCKAPSAAQLSTSTLTACLASLSLHSSQQTRHASILSRLSNNKGAVKERKRVGRGPSSGHGKTSGRGHKGQGQHGKVKPWFQGGQTPLIVQKGRKGFDNIRAPVMSEVNLDKLQDWINQGRIDPTQRITPKELIQSNLVGSIKDGIKLLARGGRNTLQQPIDIITSKASSGAIEAIERAGGKIVTRYYTKLSMRRLISGESEHTDKPLPQGKEYVEPVLDQARQKRWKYRLPDPTSREDIEYYRDPAHRGYLSHQLKEGESPSLYFKVPAEKKIKSASAEASKKKTKKETMW